MSIDGLLPSKLSYVNVERQVPVVATVFACIFIALLATFFDIKVSHLQMTLFIKDYSDGF